MTTRPEIDKWAADWGLGGASNALEMIFKRQTDATRDPRAMAMGAALVQFLAAYNGRGVSDPALMSEMYRDEP